MTGIRLHGFLVCQSQLSFDTLRMHFLDGFLDHSPQGPVCQPELLTNLRQEREQSHGI